MFSLAQTSLYSILLELSTSEDPTWVYFDSQHKYALERLNKVHEKACAHVDGALLLCSYVFFLTSDAVHRR